MFFLFLWYNSGMILPSVTALHTLSGKRVFVRVDVNVPLARAGKEWRVTNDWRIKSVLPTLDYLLSRGARVMLGAHLGRPEARRKAELSLKLVAACLAEMMKYPVRFVPELMGKDSAAWKNQKKGTVLFF